MNNPGKQKNDGSEQGRTTSNPQANNTKLCCTYMSFNSIPGNAHSTISIPVATGISSSNWQDDSQP
jgi:hypothetical protein